MTSFDDKIKLSYSKAITNFTIILCSTLASPTVLYVPFLNHCMLIFSLSEKVDFLKLHFALLHQIFVFRYAGIQCLSSGTLGKKRK